MLALVENDIFNNTTSSNMITEEMYEMEIPITIDKDLVTSEYDSFARGFHVIWTYGILW